MLALLRFALFRSVRSPLALHPPSFFGIPPALLLPLPHPPPADFFNSGCGAWFDSIKDLTFTSTFCDLSPVEAAVIVDHWEARRRLVLELQAGATDATDEGAAAAIAAATSGELNFWARHPAVAALLEAALEKLGDLRGRLDAAVSAEAALSPAGKAFVKLSTRSPKDSKKALARAKRAYQDRLDALAAAGGDTSANARWRILCEESGRSGAVADGAGALELLLDSDRVFEDLEYALRGPPVEEGVGGGDAGEGQEGGAGSGAGDGDTDATTSTSAALPLGSPLRAERAWMMDLVARAWDPRLTPESEFRGICWNGTLTCLSQYFHPLHFPEMVENRAAIEADILACAALPTVKAAVDRMGGHCIVDFAWLGPGEVIIVELNPFDGVCLGTFPASTGLFLWETPEDKAVMKGDAPFEFRLRTEPLNVVALKTQCNPEWREIIYTAEHGFE